MRSFIQRAALLLGAVVGLIGTRPATANAQKALVYCPITVDATGCNAIVTALTGPAYPLGVDRGYDGTGGTVDLKAVDLFTYAVFVVPSLADDATSQPYAKLRDPEVVEHLKAALIGRIAMWSGTPDQGATNRGLKDALIQNLAGWAGGAFGAAKGPGLVALLDASATTSARYDWVRAITPVPVTSDPALLIYNAVRSLDQRASSILTSGAGPIVFDNMATFGFQMPNGAAGVTLDAVGQTGTSQGGQVVLLTMEGGNSGGAIVKTDTDDYPPGTTVVITGSGWQPGETVTLSLHEDPLVDTDRSLTATADADGNFVNTQFAPEQHDLLVRFVLTATGQTSGRRAQTTFTDGQTDFGVSISPISATSAQSQSYVLRIWNASDQASTGLGSANVTVPTGWTVTTPLATPTTSPSSKTWTAALVSGVIQLRATANSQQLARTNGGNAADTVKLTFTATAPPVGSATVYTWSTLARAAINFTGNDWAQSGADAVVTVSPLANTATTTTPSNASATYGDASVSLTATVTSTSTVNSGTVTFTVTQGATTIGSATTSPTVVSGNASATYALPAGTAAGPYTVQAVYNPGSGFSGSTGNATLTIGPKTLTPNVTVSNKIYDGTTAATIATRTLTGGLAADAANVSLTGGTATFVNKDVGTGKSVTVTGLGLSGTAAANYVLASSSLSTTANITTKPITVTALTDTKQYDGTTTSAGTPTISPALAGGDTPAFTQAFATKTVATAKTLTPAGSVNDGNSGNNYAITFAPVTTGVITARALTGTITANNKTYDGTTTATATAQPLLGIIGTDAVTLVVGATNFDTKNVGTGKTVTAALSLTGADAANYTINPSATALANITGKALTATITASTKVYDGNTAAVATGHPLVGVAASDAVTLVVGSATFDTKNVGTGKTVSAPLSLSGADAPNYSVNATATALANITARTLVVTGTGTNKVYDATTVATVTLSDDRVSGDVFTTSYTSAAFADKNVGTAKMINVTGIAISGTDAGNYLPNTNCTATADITAKSVTGSFTVSDKIYDGNTTATIATRNLSGQISGDVVSLTGGSATFATKTVGTNKTVSGTGFTLGGTDALNYALTSSLINSTGNITGRALTVAATGVNKIYDATATAAVTLSDNHLSGDDVTDAYVSATFADRNVGTAKPVSVSGISIGGTDAGNYTFNNTASTTADITPRALAVAAAGVNKIYDGTTSATVTLSDNRVAGDVLATAYTAATFDTKHVGTGKTVSVSGIGITGADAGNYTFNTTTTTTANITARGLAVTATGINKIYDGNTTATVTLADDRVAGDAFTASYSSASFVNKNVGNAKPVTVGGITLTGNDAGDYTPNTSTTTTANITARALTVTATGANKTYDATTNAIVSLADDHVTGDVVVDTYTTATFGDKNVGTGKTVSVSGIALSGADAPNYTFNTTATTTANIAVATVTGSFTAPDKVYDGNASATIGTRTVTGTLSSDNLSLTGGSATFADKNVGTAKIVTGTGFTLGGSDAGNYVLQYATLTTTANVTPRALLVSAAGVNKVYDATTAATVTLSDDRVSGDVFTDLHTTATFADKHVGIAKTVSVAGISLTGADAGNYTPNTTANTTADITAATVVGSITADNKVYDGNAIATIATRNLSGVLLTDVVTLSGGTATFPDKSVGNGRTVTATAFTLIGTDATNYVLSPTTISTTANITPRALTISATGIDKIYDGTNVATVTLADNRVSGDVFTDSYTSATFDTKNVGNVKPISVIGISISGTDAGNYTFNYTASASANVTPRALVVSATGVNKVYDGNTTATVTLADNRVLNDVFTTAYTTATFTDKNVGTAKTVNVSGISLAGVDATNYTFNATATTAADITKRALTIAATGVSRIYDGTATATVTLADNRVSGDVFTDSYTAAGFADKSVGTAKPVSVSGISISGTDAGNYSFNYTASTTADITQRALVITATGVDRMYDATATATVTLADNRVAGDVFTDGYASAAFADKNAATAKPVAVNGISISGADAPNYTFNTTTATTASITVATLTGSFTAGDKTYDGNTTAAITGRNVSGTLLSDVVSMVGGSATFNNKNVGSSKTVSGTGFTLSGTDAGNYVLASTSLTTTASITARTLTISAAGINRVYDGTAVASVTLSDNRVPGDVFNDTYTGASFTDKNVGTGKAVSVSGIAISGMDGGNYSFNTTASTTADITPKTLTVSATGVDKGYDGNTTATVTLGDDRVAGDVLSLAYGSASFNTKTVDTSKPVSVSGISVTGTDALNYTFNATASTTANITQRPLTITATGVNKIYDGNADATVTFTDNRVSGDNFTTSYTAVFNNANAGTAKPVSVSGISISGADAANYTFNVTAGATADITPRPITITVAAKTKLFGTVDPPLTSSTTSGTLVNMSDLTGALTRVAGEDVGTYTIQQGTLALTANYALTFIGANLTITKATPAISWTGLPATMNQGLPLTAAQLNAFAVPVNVPGQVAGTMTYTLLPSTTVSAGTPVYGVGSYDIKATFTPTDGNYYGNTAINTITLTNVAPVVTSITLPTIALPLGSPTNLSAKFTDAGLTDTHTYSIDWDWDLQANAKTPGSVTTSFANVATEPTASVAGTLSSSYTYITPGVYTVRVTVKDNSGLTGSRTSQSELFAYVVAYDASSGFVTGGGWINSPAGACQLTTACGGAVGKANFGFVAKYKKGQAAPDGNTEFQFQAGNLNFSSTSYEWLVVAGTKAQYKGVGTINGGGTYGFILTATDGDTKGSPDTFRMKIWVKNANGTDGPVVYDNQMGAPDDGTPTMILGGGSIQIHAN